MKHSKESASESETQCCRRFRFKNQGSVVQLQSVHTLSQFFVVFRIDRIDSCEYHRLYLLKALNRHLAGPQYIGNRIAYLNFTGFLYTRYNITYVACRNFILGQLGELQGADFISNIFFSGSNKFNAVAFLNFSVLYFEIGHNSAE